MSGKQSSSIDAIKTAIAEGSLTKREIERRLEGVVAHEIDRKDGPADLKLVNACLDLLCEIQTHGQLQFESHALKNKNAVLARYEKRTRRNRRRSILARIAVVTAVLCVCALGIEIVFHRELFIDSVTLDEQQYYVQGVVEDPNIVKDGQAQEIDRPDSLITSDLDEALSFYGFTPPLLQWLPDGWSAIQYSVHHREWYSRLVVTYGTSSSDHIVSYEVRHFDNLEDAYASFEQDVEGKAPLNVVPNGYYSMNQGEYTAIWYKGNMVFSIYGALSEDDFLKIVKSIGG